MVGRNGITKQSIPYLVSWVKRFLEQHKLEKVNDSEKIEKFLSVLQNKSLEDWQLKQAKHTLNIYTKEYLGQANASSQLKNNSRKINNLRWDDLERDVRQSIGVKPLSLKTEKSYLFWVKKFRVFLKEKQTNRLNSKVSASTQNLAFNSLLFLYRNVLAKELEGMKDTHRAKEPETLPIVFSQNEMQQLFKNLSGQNFLLAQLLYGCGLRLMEGISIRIKDVDLNRMKLHIHRAKGGKDRYLKIPDSLREPLGEHISKTTDIHNSDLKMGLVRVISPDALDKNFYTITKKIILTDTRGLN